MIRPLLHFLVLGALLFAARQLTSGGRALGLGAEPIVVGAAQVERLHAEWRAQMRREPTRQELTAAIRAHADEETLVREALRLGLDRSDPVVRGRLVRNLRFARDPRCPTPARSPATEGCRTPPHGGVPEPAAAMGEEALLAEALALGMASRDVVARRRLVQAMEERLAAGVQVTVDDVREHVTAHAGRYAAPRRVSFDQVFVSADRHRDGLARRSAEVAARLPGLAPEHAAALGDPFLAGTRFVAQSRADVARMFGDGLAQAVLGAPVGTWTGPLPSAYGRHFVRVDAVLEPQVAELAAVYHQARYALLGERERATVRDALVGLRRVYPLQVEWPALAMAGAS